MVTATTNSTHQNKIAHSTNKMPSQRHQARQYSLPHSAFEVRENREPVADEQVDGTLLRRGSFYCARAFGIICMCRSPVDSGCRYRQGREIQSHTAYILATDLHQRGGKGRDGGGGEIIYLRPRKPIINIMT